MREPAWVSLDAVVAIHERQLAEHGGLAGTRDRGLLESALARPRNQFFYGSDNADVCGLAAAYAYGIATNHPFLDGNKRSAHVVARIFLLLNGKDQTASREEKYLTIMKLAAGDLTEDELAAWFRANSKDV